MIKITLPPRRIENPLCWGNHIRHLLRLRSAELSQRIRPWSVTFFPNGMACVGNVRGEQLPKYQVGTHRDTVLALAIEGYDWSKLPDVWGVPVDPSGMIVLNAVEHKASSTS